ncbi:MAG: hypothetical protein ACJATA_001489 [Sphingobacteriales bacterium]|jgi:hypothetical protein
MMKRFGAFLCGSLFLMLSAEAQSPFLPLNHESYHAIQRLEIMENFLDSNIFSSVKPYSRRDVAHFADKFNTLPQAMSARDRLNLYYMTIDNVKYTPEPTEDRIADKNVFNRFYLNKTDFYKVDKGGLYVRINPVLRLEAEYEKSLEKTNLRYSRGAEVQGILDDKVSFYTQFTENVEQFPDYLNRLHDSTGRIPGVAYNTKNSAGAIDYFDARGYINFSVTKHIHLTFGHDNNFIGNGYRSLILSDNVAGNLFLKVQTHFGRFTYTNLFNQFVNVEKTQSDGVRPKKYLSLHHLSFNAGKNLNFGIFEGVMQSRDDNSFDVNYLNPIIFYRSLERYLGSPDNVILGADFKYNFLKSGQIYGQFVLDEFRAQELFPNTNWWGNKYAWQLGGRYINMFGIYNLDAQIEYNRARPFIYSHGNTSNGFHHYGQPIAHPLGANFTEWVAILDYQPAVKWFFQSKAIIATKGDNENGLNYGGDPLLSNRSRAKEYDNFVGQGETHDILYLSQRLTYRFHHGMNLDLNWGYRVDETKANNTKLTDNFFGLGLRINIENRKM